MAIENNLTIGESSPKKSFSSNFSTHEVLGKILVLATPILFILIWYIVASGTTPLILPSPDDVFMRLVSYFVNGKKAIKAAIITFGAIPKPNQITNIGARANFGKA